jgi:hypothetical protein
MAELQTLRAEARVETGKNAAHRVRNTGAVPAIMYGGQDAPQPIAINEREFSKHYLAGTLLSTLFIAQSTSIFYASPRARALPCTYRCSSAARKNRPD